ncbi:hypothetical protein B9G55_21870 [Saccharibacillus sp. O16]|nr:hypothetical protein B9G55_21870 [Saccharibacillus sp. O16]
MHKKMGAGLLILALTLAFAVQPVIEVLSADVPGQPTVTALSPDQGNHAPPAGDRRYVSNRYTQPEQEAAQAASANPSLEGMKRVAANDKLELYVQPKTLGIKIKNKHTGYIWSSTVDHMERYRLNQSWKDFVESALTIEYLNRQGKPMRESLTTNDSTVELRERENGFEADVDFAEARIKLTLTAELTEDGFMLRIPADSIKESKRTRMVSLQAYPFLGAVYQKQIPGYMLIPDGAGALIRYDHPAKMDSPYLASVYGRDRGFESASYAEDVNPEYPASMPVFGMVHGVKQNAMLTMIESGDPYSQIMAYKAGLSTDFNWISAKFIYRYAYKQPTSRSEEKEKAIEAYQEQANNFDVALHYRILEGDQADYVGLARAYRTSLEKAGKLVRQPEDAEPALLRAEFLAAEKKEGLIRDRAIAMTPVDALAQFADELEASGVKKPFMVYKGWYDKGLHGSQVQKFPLERKLGSQQELQDAVKELEQRGIDVFFHTDYVKALEGSGGWFGGTEFAKQINSRSIQETQGELTYSFIAPLQGLELARKQASDYAAYGMTKVALDSADLSFSTFGEGAAASRSDNQQTFLDTAALLGGQQSQRVALYRPNAYAWGAAGKYLDAPMSSSGYLYASDTVPFLPIVLKGYMDLYSPFVNFSPDPQSERLKLIDYGIFPSFYLTEKSSFALADTDSRDVYTSEFDTWKGEIVKHYQTMEQSLAAVKNATIENREVLIPGVVKVSYSNGVAFVINYTGSPFARGGVSVGPEDFTMLKGE